MSCILFHGLSKDGSPTLSMETFPLPSTMLEGEVLVQLEGATLCNSDLHTLAGRRQEPTPAVLGHEGCGKVVLSSRGSVAVGERVTFSVTDVCGVCDRCTGGPQQKCRNLLKYGHVRHSPDSVPLGCYSTHILLGQGTAVVPLPPQLDTVLATPVNCALATMVAARKCARQGLGRYSGERLDKKVLIFGGGLLGLYGCSLFKEDGFKVFLSDKSDARRKQAVDFGAERVTEEDIKKNEYDAVIEVCGVGSVVSLGLSLLKPGGVVVLVGCVTPDTKLDITGDQVIRKCATLMGVHNYEQEDLAEAVHFLTRTPYQEQFRSIISEPVPLSKFEDALQLARGMKFHRVLLDTRA